MKKLLSLMMVLFILITPAIAEGLDLEGMDYDSLMQLKRAVDAELYSRPEAEPITLAPGVYEIGKDIHQGRYFARVNSYEFGKSNSSRVSVYESNETVGNWEGLISQKWLSIEDGSTSIDLTDGAFLEILDFPVTLSVSELTEEELYEYVPPEGTYVPAGTYVVGEDLPAGGYQIFMGTIVGCDVLVYDDENTFENGKYSQRAELRTIWDGHVGSISVKEGNIVKVENDVVMKKQPKLEFD